MFLIVTHSYLKLLEVIQINNANSMSAIHALENSFTTHGYFGVVVSDNWLVFTSLESELFVKSYGIKQTRSAPYHPHEKVSEILPLHSGIIVLLSNK